jgi:hypothetical protein
MVPNTYEKIANAQIILTEEVRTLRKNCLPHLETKFRQGIKPVHPKNRYFPEDVKRLKYWRSVATRPDMNECLKSYYGTPMKWSSDRRAQHARRMVDRILPDTKVQPLSLTDGFDRLPQGSSPGLPFSIYGKSKKSQVRKQTLNYVRRAVRQMKNKEFVFPPCNAAARCQLKLKPKNKPRLVWCYPSVVSTLEAIFAFPLIDLLKQCENFAWNCSWLHGSGPGLFNTLVRTKGAVIGMDVSNFDASISAKAIHWAFSILKKRIHFTEKWHHLAFNKVEDYFINTPILFYNRMYMTRHGIPSGSTFTQLIGNLVNMYLCIDMTLMLYSARVSDCRLPMYDDMFVMLKVLGDDSLIKLKFGLYSRDNEFFASYFYTKHKITVHPDKGCFKSYVANLASDSSDVLNFEFLGKNMRNAMSFTIDTELLRAQALIPEDTDSEPGDALTRLIGLAWSCGTSLRHHTMLKEYYDQISDLYPGCTPTPWKRDLLRMWRYVYGDIVPPLVFPRFSSILDRYLRS